MSSSNNQNPATYDVHIAYDPSGNLQYSQEKLHEIIEDSELLRETLEQLERNYSAIIAKKITLPEALRLEEKYQSIGFLVEVKEVIEPIVRVLTLEPEDPPANQDAHFPTEDETNDEANEVPDFTENPSFFMEDDATLPENPENQIEEITQPTPANHNDYVKNNTIISCLSDDYSPDDEDEDNFADENKHNKEKHKNNKQTTTKKSSKKLSKKSIEIIVIVAFLLLISVVGFMIYQRFKGDDTASVQVASEQTLATPTTKTPKLNKNIENSLIYISKNNKNKNFEKNISTLFLLNTTLNPEQQTLTSPLLKMPKELQDNLLLRLIDTLLNLRQLDRAQDIYQQMMQSNPNFQHSRYMLNAHIHILAHQATGLGQESEKTQNIQALQDVINKLPDTKQQIEAWIYTAQTAAQYHLPIENWLEKTAPLLNELHKKDKKKARYLESLITMSQAKNIYQQAILAKEKGLKKDVQKYSKELNQLKINYPSALTQFASGLYQYRLATELNKTDQASKAATKVNQAASQLFALQDSQQALLLWQQLAPFIDSTQNQNILNQIEPIIKTRLSVDEEALILYQICRQIQQKECIERVSSRAFEDEQAPPQWVHYFGLQNQFNVILNNAQQAHTQDRLPEAENWLRKAADELF